MESERTRSEEVAPTKAAEGQTKPPGASTGKVVWQDVSSHLARNQLDVRRLNRRDVSAKSWRAIGARWRKRDGSVRASRREAYRSVRTSGGYCMRMRSERRPCERLRRDGSRTAGKSLRRRGAAASGESWDSGRPGNGSLRSYGHSSSCRRDRRDSAGGVPGN